jgi:hypothetical protein
MSNLSKTNSVARMAINPGMPITSAMPRERPFNGADDGEDDCGSGKDNNVVADDFAEASIRQ